MKRIVKQSLLKDIDLAISILETSEQSDLEKLKELSDHTIKDVALYKNMDAISLAVLVYSVYKVLPCITDENLKNILAELKSAKKYLNESKFGRYNSSLETLFKIVKTCSSKLSVHLQDVLHAAKIKKGTTLLEHGLSASRTADLMGISKWELLDYTGQTNVMEVSEEIVSAKKRVSLALDIFAGKQSKVLFFDAGPIITLAMSRLLWILKPLKEKFGGKFYITNAVKKELVENPIRIPKFEFEALQVMKLIREGILEIYPKVAAYKTKNLAKLSNHTYSVNQKWMEIIQEGEMETVLASLNNSSTPIIMDERTMRLLIEDGKALKTLLERRTNKSVEMDQDSIDQFHQAVGKVPIIRSIELAAVAYKFGILDAYLPKELPNPKEKLLTAVLWNTKYNGCAVTDAEIAELRAYLL